MRAYVCAWTWMEREDEVMISTPTPPGQLTFPWRFLIKANVRPNKEGKSGRLTSHLPKKHTQTHLPDKGYLSSAQETFWDSFPSFGLTVAKESLSYLSDRSIQCLIDLPGVLGFLSLGEAGPRGGDGERSCPFGF